MLKKIHSNRKGFTLVEIMIVVSIIAMLSMIVIPSFVRAHKRAQATTLLNTLRLINTAKGQYAIDYNKTTVLPASIDLRGYFEEGTPLYQSVVNGGVANSFQDPKLSNVTFWINSTDVFPSIDVAGAFSDIVDATFWSPYVADNGLTAVTGGGVSGGIISGATGGNSMSSSSVGSIGSSTGSISVGGGATATTAATIP